MAFCALLICRHQRKPAQLATHWATQLAASLHETHLALGLGIVLLNLLLTLRLFLHDVGFRLIVEQELVVPTLRVLQLAIRNLQAAWVSASTTTHPCCA